MEYRGAENLGLGHDPMMEHLGFTSSFHNRPSYGKPLSTSHRSNHLREGSAGSYSEHRGDVRKQSYGSQSGGIPASYSWDSKDSRASQRSGQTTDSQSRRIAGGSNYNHNKRISRTKIAQEERSQRTSHDRRSRHEVRREHTTVDEGDENFLHTSDNVIALFGAYGTTGQHFLQFALEAGYRVRVLLLPGVQLDIPESKNLTVVTGTLDEEQKIERVLKKASYVVCMLGDCTKIIEEKDGESSHSNYRFIQRLVSILERVRSKRVLLYQASSVALDNEGSTPILSSLVKKMQITKAKREALAEQDKIVAYLSTQLDQDSCRYIITRPSDLIWDKPSKRKLAASKSQPGPFAITNIDLAEFSLNALKNEKLYNTCPYVVKDY
ncbi:unnamed protein product [Cylindrotheca closterium]|uniref:NAD(P)-binding domain-containing protein n=1 Tax=Cylindrotheca closterium TaxID=2856 RepID=A0AAD2G9T8_9STRA|nr:unnamed protein product [Cylindrotheca closterium]